MRLWVILCVVLVSAGPSWATTRYVAKAGDGGSDANSCAASTNIATPKLTLASALPCVEAGDTLLIRTGTYVEMMRLDTHTVTGTANSRVWIGAYNGETVTIAPGGAVEHVVVFSGSTDYVTIDGLILDGTSTWNTDGAAVFRGYGTSDGMILQNSEVKNGPYSGVFLSAGTGFQLLNNHIHTNGTGAGLPGGLGVYINGATDSLVRGNIVHDNNCAGIRSFNSSATPQANRNIIERNRVYNNGSPAAGVGSCVGSDESGIFVGDRDSTVRYNEVYGNGGHGIYIFKGGGTCTGNTVYNNTAYNNPYGIRVRATCTNSIIRNNLSVGNTTSNYTDNGSGTGTVQSNNRTTGSITDCTVSTSDFTQTPGSSCIDAGSTLTGLTYNGTAPDQGAYESFVIASAEVGTIDATSLILTFTNNLTPPLLPSTGITGITVRENTTPVTVSSCARTGDNVVDCTLAASITNGTTVDWSYAQTGNLTDSSLIGNTTNQELLTVTNSAVTNNVGAGAPTYVFTQARYEFHGKYGTEAAPIISPDGVAATGAAENFTNMTVIPGGSLRVRFAVTCTTADCPPVGFIPRYSKNGGAYTVIPDAFAADNIGFCGASAGTDIPNNGAATTDQLSTSGTFVAGAVVLTSNAIPTIDIALNGKTELEYCITFDADATAGDYYDLRLYNQDGSTITYTVTPRITINAAAGGFGELWELLLFAMLPVLGRIESQTAKPASNLAVSHPHVDQVLIEGMACTTLKTTGTGLKRTVTCLH